MSPAWIIAASRSFPVPSDVRIVTSENFWCANPRPTLHSRRARHVGSSLNSQEIKNQNCAKDRLTAASTVALMVQKVHIQKNAFAMPLGMSPQFASAMPPPVSIANPICKSSTFAKAFFASSKAGNSMGNIKGGRIRRVHLTHGRGPIVNEIGTNAGSFTGVHTLVSYANTLATGTKKPGSTRAVRAKLSETCRQAEVSDRAGHCAGTGRTGKFFRRN